MLWRMGEFHHLSHILCPLEAEAVDEDERLVDSSCQQVSVDGDHPTVQCYSTPEKEEKTQVVQKKVEQ